MKRRAELAIALNGKKPMRVTWPEGKAFAFTIFDDTDGSYVENTAPIYQVLKDLGFRTTKTAWPLATPDAPSWRGDSCESPTYLDWIKQLQADGFEIGCHMASCQTSDRAKTIVGIERFKQLFGPPAVYANHYDNLEAIYWGDARTSGLARLIFRALNRFRSLPYKGHVEGDPLFWGDVCRREIEFVRNFVFADINTLKKCPRMPYYDPSRPFVKSWYASSDASDGNRYCQLLALKNQERLEREGGACIVYTHLARDFMRDGEVRRDFRELMTALARRNGWFVPVGPILRHIRDQHGGVHELTPWQRRQLEWTWLWDKLFLGKS